MCGGEREREIQTERERERDTVARMRRKSRQNHCEEISRDTRDSPFFQRDVVPHSRARAKRKRGGGGKDETGAGRARRGRIRRVLGWTDGVEEDVSSVRESTLPRVSRVVTVDENGVNGQ